MENASQASSKARATATASTVTPESSTETVSSEAEVEQVVASESQSKQVSKRETGNRKQVSKGNQVQQRKAKTESGLDTQAKGKTGTKQGVVDTEDSTKDNTEGAVLSVES